MKEFEDFLEAGDVRLQEKNKILADALAKSAEKGLIFVRKLEINEENSEHIVADVYDILRGLIEVKLALEGYKSYSHEATILFLKKFKQFNEFEISFMDNLRKIRNGIKYYGKEASPEDAAKTLDFMNSILPKLKKLAEDKK